MRGRVWRKPLAAGFNNTSNMAMLGHAVKYAVGRSGVEPAEVEDVVAGCVAASGNVARGAALLAGLPDHDLGHRRCTARARRGLNAIANAARYVIDDGAQIVVGSGVDSITFQNGGGGGKGAENRRDVSRLLDANDRHRRCRGCALQYLPRISGRILPRIPRGAWRQRSEAGKFKRRDRADGDGHEGRPTRRRRRRASSTTQSAATSAIAPTRRSRGSPSSSR